MEEGKPNKVHKLNTLLEKAEERSRGNKQLRHILAQLNDQLCETVEPVDGVSVNRVNWNS